MISVLPHVMSLAKLFGENFLVALGTRSESIMIKTLLVHVRGFATLLTSDGLENARLR